MSLDQNAGGPGATTRSAQGTVLVVVGPSGAGKDSLIDHARRELAQDNSVLFVRRTVTRKTIAQTEDHDCLSVEEFAAAQAEGRFTVSWNAHGLYYGIPVTVHDHLQEGGIAIVNGSRAALPEIIDAFDKVIIIHITAQLEILAERLARRGRETAADILPRLQRASIALPNGVVCIEIDNSGAIETAANAFLEAISRSWLR